MGGWFGGSGSGGGGASATDTAFIAGGRLTLESGVAVSTADQVAKTTLYYTPFIHNRISLYSGTEWTPITFSETSIALGTLTSGLPYDVFAYDNSGTAAFELLAWTNGTTRATALTTQDGITVKSGASTRRYIGTIYTTSTTTTEDSDLNRLVWNMDNRVSRRLRVVEATDSWTYTTAAYRAANASTANRVGVVTGMAGVSQVDLWLWVFATNSLGSSAVAAICEDGTSGPGDGSVGLKGYVGVANGGFLCESKIVQRVALGYHFYQWVEYATASGTTTWYGDAGTSSIHQSGFVGNVEN